MLSLFLHLFHRNFVSRFHELTTNEKFCFNDKRHQWRNEEALLKNVDIILLSIIDSAA